MNSATDKYINLFTDFGFKRIVGEEPNKEILKSILNAFLHGVEEVSDVEVLKIDSKNVNENERETIFDFKCSSPSNEAFIVEIMRAKNFNFIEHSIYSSTFAIQSLVEEDGWFLKLKSVYVIVLNDFIFESSDEKLRHHLKFMDTSTQTGFYDKLSFLYFEIPKFNKPLHELSSNYERWLYVFKNLHLLEEQPIELQDDVFQTLFLQAEISKLNKTTRDMYEKSLKDYRVLKNSSAQGEVEGV
jgi:predicted transposase/invertase (TIGR01784 family)